MKHKTQLKRCREHTGLLQQDVSYLFQLDPALYNRYERNRRTPTLEVILGYHILFGSGLEELFPHQYRLVKERITARSKKLIEQLKADDTQRGKYRLSYLTSFVNGLHNKRYD